MREQAEALAAGAVPNRLGEVAPVVGEELVLELAPVRADADVADWPIIPLADSVAALVVVAALVMEVVVVVVAMAPATWAMGPVLEVAPVRRDAGHDSRFVMAAMDPVEAALDAAQALVRAMAAAVVKATAIQLETALAAGVQVAAGAMAKPLALVAETWPEAEVDGVRVVVWRLTVKEKVKTRLVAASGVALKFATTRTPPLIPTCPMRLSIQATPSTGPFSPSSWRRKRCPTWTSTGATRLRLRA